jgi:hypothetical protein
MEAFCLDSIIQRNRRVSMICVLFLNTLEKAGQAARFENAFMEVFNGDPEVFE